jgi:hypothetical protein
MNHSRLALAALGGLVASFAVGFLVLWLVPALFDEARKYPHVFRSQEEMMAVMPVGIAANFVAILVAAIIFALMHRGGSRTAEGARLGVLVGTLAVCNVLHNYANLPVTSEHAVSIDALPDLHKDPFDRILLAQALTEGITLLTADAQLARYGGPVRKV